MELLKAFLCLLFLAFRKWVSSASMAFPEFQGAGSDSCSLGKGVDAKTREEELGKNSTALGQDPGSLSRDTHNDIGLLHTQEKRYIPSASFRNE